MVSAALRLQPLLARAQKLRAKDEAVPLTSVKNSNGEACTGNLRLVLWWLFKCLHMVPTLVQL